MMDHELIEKKSREILHKEIFDKKKKYNDQIPDFYKLIASLSAVMLSMLATLYQKPVTPEPFVSLCFQATLVSLLVALVSAVTAIYGKVYSHLHKIESIGLAVQKKGSYDAALLSLQKNPIILQPRIFAWSHYVCFGSFLASQVLIALYGIANAI